MVFSFSSTERFLHAVFCNKNRDYRVSLKRHLTVFFHLLESDKIYLMEFVSGQMLMVGRQVDWKEIDDTEMKKTLWLDHSKIMFINLKNCNYGAKKISVVSSTKSCIVKDVFNIFQYCIQTMYVQEGEPEVTRKLETRIY